MTTGRINQVATSVAIDLSNREDRPDLFRSRSLCRTRASSSIFDYTFVRIGVSPKRNARAPLLLPRASRVLVARPRSTRRSSS